MLKQTLMLSQLKRQFVMTGSRASEVCEMKVNINKFFLTALLFGLVPASLHATAPLISDVADQVIAQNTTTVTNYFTVGDTETAFSALVVTASSGNSSLVPNASDNLILGGSNSQRTIKVAPASNQTGTAVITLSNTIVVLWSDNGWHLGEKEITGKNSLWERSTHVPLIFAGPGVANSARCTQPVELLDIYPNFPVNLLNDIPAHAAIARADKRLRGNARHMRLE